MRHIDVAVIGAGPAGLAAAVRARWVKAYRGVPCSVAVFDPAPAGGLAALGAPRLTGPTPLPLIQNLLNEMRTLSLSITPAPVDAIRRAGFRWALESEGRECCRARAVVLATGLRRLANEADYFRKGLSLTHNGYDDIPRHLEALCAGRNVRDVLIIGNAKTENLLPVVNAVRRRRPETRFTFLLNESPSDALRRRFQNENVLFGRAARFSGASDLEEAICECGAERIAFPCQLAFVDYVAFEIKPERTVAAEGLARDAHGFVVIQRDGATNLPGVFAAGDATGMLAMALKAIAEGSIAGFAAYRHVFSQKFGCAAPLFAYAAVDAPLVPEASDYPDVNDSDLIEPLAPMDFAPEALARDAEPFFKNGPATTYGALRRALGEEKARDLLWRMLDAKWCTIQPREDAAGDA